MLSAFPRAVIPSDILESIDHKLLSKGMKSPPKFADFRKKQEKLKKEGSAECVLIALLSGPLLGARVYFSVEGGRGVGPKTLF